MPKEPRTKKKHDTLQTNEAVLLTPDSRAPSRREKQRKNVFQENLNSFHVLKGESERVAVLLTPDSGAPSWRQKRKKDSFQRSLNSFRALNGGSENTSPSSSSSTSSPSSYSSASPSLSSAASLIQTPVGGPHFLASPSSSDLGSITSSSSSASSDSLFFSPLPRVPSGLLPPRNLFPSPSPLKRAEPTVAHQSLKKYLHQ
jgi:hypothetical protein